MRHEVYRIVLPLLPEAVVLVAGLVVLIALRRRLGPAAPMAFGGFALLALATAGDVAWKLWALSREWGSVSLTDDGGVRQPAGLELTRDLDDLVGVTLLVIYLAGLAIAGSAVFAARHSTVEGRSR